jgi:hypothetical protein
MELIEHLEDRLVPVFLDCNPGAERAAVGRGVKDDRDDVTLLRTFVQRVVNFPHHGDVENIHGWP